MKKSREKRTIYFSDELNDDFAGTNIKKQAVNKNYRYANNVFEKICSFLVYYLLAVPLVWFYVKIILRVKFVNKKAVKKFKKQPYFLYGNHTGYFDVFTPNLISFPRRNRIISSADAVSIKGIKTLVKMLGALPIPEDYGGMKNFIKAIDFYHKKSNITINPEAHIWPYYNGIRPFSDTSFYYPIKLNSPVFAFFTAFSKPKGFLSVFRKANITVYISDAFFPNEGNTEKEKKKILRDKVYNFMLEKSKLSDYEVIKYLPAKSDKKNIS